MRRRALILVAVVLALAACASSSSGDGRTVVGGFYPLAWAADRLGDGAFSVLDLTPPGVEAHDVNLTAEQVGQIETADVVLLLGYLGFQPQVEDAAREAEEDVVLLTSGLSLLPSSEEGLSHDPHVWLDPVLMREMVKRIGDALERADSRDRAAIERRTRSLSDDLAVLDADYRSGLSSCTYSTFITTHEAFGYLADEYGLDQFGIEGLTPEAEPSANQIQDAIDAIETGEAAPAVFFEETDEGKRIGKSVASDAGAEAFPLDTLEFEPTRGDYLSVMRQNLANLERGLECQT